MSFFQHQMEYNTLWSSTSGHSTACIRDTGSALHRHEDGGSGDRGGGYQQNHFPQRAQWMLSPEAGVQVAADILTVTG